jgi:hypothetical protein
MRRRRLKKLIKRLRQLQQQNLTRDELLLKLGAAKKEAGKAYALLRVIHTPTKDQPVTLETFHFALDRKKLRQARRREGSWSLRQRLIRRVIAKEPAPHSIHRVRVVVHEGPSAVPPARRAW